MLLHKRFPSIVSRIYGEKKFGIGDMHEMISDNDKSLYFRVITIVTFHYSNLWFISLKYKLLIFLFSLLFVEVLSHNHKPKVLFLSFTFLSIIVKVCKVYYFGSLGFYFRWSFGFLLYHQNSGTTSLKAFSHQRRAKPFNIVWVKTNDNNNCQFYDHFWPFFR
jgi:hypothetical protein